MTILYDNPIAMILLCVGAFKTGLLIYEKTRLPILNPLFIAVVIVIAVLQITGIPLTTFNKGGVIINFLLCPATIVLAIPMYKQRKIIRANLLPIMVGTVVGSAFSMFSIYLICQFAGINLPITMSLVPKSTTTPIAIEIANTLGGIPAITVAAVISTGIIGNIIFPIIIKLFNLQNRIAAGLAIGTAAHGVGTAKAIELGETEGAMSGIAIGIAGMVSVAIALCV